MVLADDENFAQLNGVSVRKGTVAAALANAEILESRSTTEAQKEAALAMIKELAPALVALGLHQHLVWKNLHIQHIMEAQARQSDATPIARA